MPAASQRRPLPPNVARSFPDPLSIFQGDKDIVRSVKAQIDELFEAKRGSIAEGADEDADVASASSADSPDKGKAAAEAARPPSPPPPVTPPRPSLKERLFGGRSSPSLLKSSRMRRKSVASEMAVPADKWASLDVFHSAAAAQALQAPHHASFFDHV